MMQASNSAAALEEAELDDYGEQEMDSQPQGGQPMLLVDWVQQDCTFAEFSSCVSALHTVNCCCCSDAALNRHVATPNHSLPLYKPPAYTCNNSQFNQANHTIIACMDIP